MSASQQPSITNDGRAGDLFGYEPIAAVPVTYTIGTASGGAQRAGELIVRG